MRSSAEHGVQKGFMQLVALQGKYDDRWQCIYAIPNSGHRTISEGGRLKAEGLKAGMPDIVVPISSKGKTGMMIEFKRPKHSLWGAGRLTESQKLCHALFEKHGWAVHVCNDSQAAFQLVKTYFAE